MQIRLLMVMSKVDEPEGEDEIAGRIEQLRTLITDRFSSTHRQGFLKPKERESLWLLWRKVFNPKESDIY